MTAYRKKLIEVALPLEEINVASAREKSIRHGHPSTLHLWWARRPLATCRAVLFTSIIDDPGEEGVPQELLDRIDSLPLGTKYRHLVEEEILDKAGKRLQPQEERRLKIARERRYRLFTFIEQLVQWENSNDVDTLKTARELIHAATGGNPPPVLDPFCGGGSIPLEAQRLGLEAHGSDLNPVAVLITKAMIEIPPKFAGQPPINPEARNRIGHTGTWQGATGLADDVRYYGKWMRDVAEKRIGHLYPKVKVTEEMAQHRPDLVPLVGQELTVIAWLWARTVPSPDPAARGAHVPLVRSFVLSSKKGKEAWVEPVVDRESMTYSFRAHTSFQGLDEPMQAGTIGKSGGRCILTGSPLNIKYVREQARATGMGSRLMAIVAQGKSGRVYLDPDVQHEHIVATAVPEWSPTQAFSANTRHLTPCSYGMTRWCDLFTSRQLVALTTLSDLVAEVSRLALEHACGSGSDEAAGAAYADAVATYVALGLSRMVDLNNSLCQWRSDPAKQHVGHLFARQAIPMVWDYAEAHPFGASAGGWDKTFGFIPKAIEAATHVSRTAKVAQQSADTATLTHLSPIVSTDPPYYDNVPYADLSDFFYVWLRRSLGCVYPELLATMLVPKAEELVADPFRHGGKERSRKFFEDGMNRVLAGIRRSAHADYPVSVYYAFKQSEADEQAEDTGGPVTAVASTGWETFLQGLVETGFQVVATWPMRTELGNRMRNIDSNALASCIVLVCRPRPLDASTITRRQFQVELGQELQPALATLTQGNIAPVDLAQAAIGPGMAVFSRYAAVLEPNGSNMRVRSALSLINQEIDRSFEAQEGWYDPQTRWAVAWFATRGFAEGPYGEAEVLAVAKDSPVPTLVAAGIVRSGVGKVRLLKRDELRDDYDPAEDERVTVWEAAQHLARVLDSGGELAAARLVRRFRTTRPELEVERARDLAYRLFALCEQKRWPHEARAYNALVLSWSDIETVSQTEEAEWQAPSAERTLFTQD